MGFENRAAVRMLITDPFHPVVSSTTDSLRKRCNIQRLIGIEPSARRERPPPGVDAIYSCPSPGTEGFLAAVTAVVREESVTTVLPWTDTDAVALAPHRELFEGLGASLVCPPSELVELACDKASCLAAIAATGVAVPKTRVINSSTDLASAATELGYPRQRLIIKPRGLSGGRGLWVLRPDPDMSVTYPAPQACLDTLSLMLDRQQAGQFIVQQLVEGIDVSVDVLAEQGHLAVAVARTRDSTLGGLCVAGTVQPVSGLLRETLETLVKGLSWSGLANVQLVISKNRPPTVYEINARAAGSIGVSAYAGVDFLSEAIAAAHPTAPGHATPGYTNTVSELVTVPRSIAFRRHWRDQVWPATPTVELTR